MSDNFVHLRVHSSYSLSEGALKIPEIVALCRAAGMPAVAITDTNNLFGALEFSAACKEAGVQPIIGCQLSLASWRGERGLNRGFEPIVVLAKDETGYRNLIRLSTSAYLDTPVSEAAHVGWLTLERHADGLIGLTGGVEGPVGRALLDGQRPSAEAALARLKDAFSDRLYVELARFGTDREKQVEPAMVDLAYAFDLPLVATNEAFFGEESMFEAHDALMCIASGTYVARRDRPRLTAEHRFKNQGEMRALFSDLPEAIENTTVIARRCAVMADARKPILPPFTSAGTSGEAKQLREDAVAGLERRLEAHVFSPGMDGAAREAAAKPYRDRLEYELGVIGQMGFAGYFLIVADFIVWAKRNGIPVGPGRGSGAGSVAAWALQITDLDPLRWGLLFERFLNPERVSMPDFDVDFCQDRRDEVIDYVRQRYGRDRVAQIITFGKLQARAALRDVGRVLQIPYGQVDRICKLVPNNPANPVTLKQAIDGEPLLQEMRRSDEAVAQMMDIALKLEGLYRHASTHAAGLVIGDRPLADLVPLYRDPRSDAPVTQFNMKDIEKAGLVKFDFLGLKTLSVLASAVALLKERGIDLDLLRLPLDDQATFELLGAGEATGIFQLESGGMRNVLRTLKPDRFEDIIAVVALYRPGPMENIPSYINRKHGKEQPDYLHPLLEPILRETYGIIIYQEQVMQIAQILAGYSLGGADLLRRAMGKKIKAEMQAQREIFVSGAVGRGVEPGLASHIFDLVEKFAGYGFNKSHAAAYALVAYQTAYLKANYPVEFFAASMTYDIGSPEKLAGFRRELTRRGIPLLPPDVTASAARFSVEQAAVRYALAAIKNVGAQAMQSLVEERQKEGKPRSLADFVARLDSSAINKRQLECLIKAGALDCLCSNRRQLLEGLDAILRFAGTARRERETGQNSLFGELDPSSDQQLKLPAVAEWSDSERLRHEFEAIGFYLSAHPLDGEERMLEKLGVTRYADLLNRSLQGVTAGSVRLSGLVLSYRQRSSAKGAKYAIMQMSDPTGLFEVLAFNEVLQASRDLLDRAVRDSMPLVVDADIQQGEDGLRLFARNLQDFGTMAARQPITLEIHVVTPAAVKELRGVLSREKGGSAAIRLRIPEGADEIEMQLPGRYAATAETQRALRALPGIKHLEAV
jgi:DNA polymerase-3 subunit alpha